MSRAEIETANERVNDRSKVVVVQRGSLAAKTAASNLGSSDETKAAVNERIRLFRRKPLLVEAEAVEKGWRVMEAGREVMLSGDEFALLYEAVDVAGASGDAVDAGLPDYEPGTIIEKDGRRMVRVEVVAGRGFGAYWYMNKPTGQDCGFKVIADMVVDTNASHFAGKFIEPWEGPGPMQLKRTWVVVRG